MRAVILRRLYSDSGKLAMAGGDGDRRYGILAHETENGRQGKGRELTASPVKAFSTFGTGSRGEVDGGDALERGRTRG